MTHAPISPDGYYYWDGVQWQSTLSADGTWRWTGDAWVSAHARTVPHESPPYESPLGLADWVSIALGLCIVTQLAQLFVLDPYYYLDLAYEGGVYRYTISVAGLATFAAAAALFLIWFHRSYRNLPALRAQERRFSPGSAVGWWFVPVACFWMPLRAAAEMWHATDPRLPLTAGGSRRQFGPSALLAGWWAAWLISLALVNLADGRSDQPVVSLVSGAATIVAALLAIAVVRSLSARQDARWARLGSPQLPAGQPSSVPG